MDKPEPPLGGIVANPQAFAPRLQSTETSQLNTALAAAQGMMVAPDKRHEAKVQTKSGGSYSYRYADLADIIGSMRKALAECGLAHTCQTAVVGDRLILRTTLRHASGEWIASEYPLPANVDPQTMGGLLTYHRRYQLCCLTGIAAEEDTDGGVSTSAAKRSAPPKEKAAEKPADTGPTLPERAQAVAEKINAATSADAVRQIVERSGDLLNELATKNAKWRDRILALADDREKRLLEAAVTP